MSSYNAIYRDVFNFHKERATRLQNTEVFWRETLAMMETIVEQNGQSELCINMLVAVWAELERRAE